MTSGYRWYEESLTEKIPRIQRILCTGLVVWRRINNFIVIVMDECTINRKRVKYLFLLLICFTPFVCHPGADANDAYADSLRMLISKGDENSLKVDQLILMGKHFYRIDYDSALFYSSMAANLSDRIGYPTGKADALYIQSLVSKNRSDLQQAQEKLDQFLEITAMLEDSIRLGKGYHQQGNLMIQKGNFELGRCQCS